MNNPIGIFDSGVGGISVLKKLKKVLPNENFIYLADNYNCPYGNKSKEEIIALSLKNCKKLIQLNCKILIVACNTATTNSINLLRDKISVSIVGIEPGIKPAINYTKTKNIGVLATEKTLNSNLFFKNLAHNLKSDINIHEQVGFDLVNMIENGDQQKTINEALISYLTPMINKKIDCLVLGCTHYNFLKSMIKKIIPNNIKLIDTITPVVNHVANKLRSENILNKSEKKGIINIFYNGNELSNNYIDNCYNMKYLEF